MTQSEIRVVRGDRDDGRCGAGAMGFQEDCLVETVEESSFQLRHGVSCVIVPRL